MSDNLWVQETFVNATEGHQFGESDVYETWTGETGELYRDCVREYGRCIGRIGVDTAEGTTYPVGWVFLKRMQYEDSDQTYLREVWVTVHRNQPRVTVRHDYMAVG